jgi:hypothetical protein
MKRLAAASAFGVLLAAIPAAADMYQDASNAKLPEARTNLGLGEVNFRDYGAKGDGVADDTAAINAAFAAWKAAIAAGGSPTLKCPPGTYKTSAPVGGVDAMPHFGSRTVRFSAWGCTIHNVGRLSWGSGEMVDKVVVDLRGNTDLTVEGLHIFAEAKVGLAWGQYRTLSGATLADKVGMNNVLVEGNYTTGACYNSASEMNHAFNLNCQNGISAAEGPDSYALIVDGMNHFNVPTYAGPVTLAVDTVNSLQTFLCSSCNIQANSGSAAAVWLGSGAYSAKFIGGYILQYSSGKPAVVLYQLSDDQPIYDAVFDSHFETDTNYAFLVAGPATNVTLQGFTYRDNVTFSTAAIFGRDNPAKTVTINNLTLAVGTFHPTPGVAIYDDPGKYTVRPTVISTPSGHPVKFPKTTQLEAPAAATPVTDMVSFRHAGYGSALTFTPLSSTNTSLQACATVRNDTPGSGAYLRLETGTGTPPALNAGTAGTVRSSQVIGISTVAHDRRTLCWPEIPVTGLQLGVPFWVDVTANVIYGGDVYLDGATVTFKEVQ